MDASMQPVAIPRQQLGIDRLPTRRISNEPRESMNCKSCRKRKIKCNRLRPSCEACQVFQCPCVYDAVPKKRGPKTDVLEALLKRVDGLEARLKHEKKSGSESNADDGQSASPNESEHNNPLVAADSTAYSPVEPVPKRARAPTIQSIAQPRRSHDAVPSPPLTSEPPPEVQTETLLDTYFAQFHGKPYFIVEEASFRHRYQAKQLPSYLSSAIFAVAARYAPHPGGSQAAVRLSERLAIQSRNEIDTDEPCMDSLQAMLLLVTAFTAAGKGRRAYMLMSMAVGMAIALELHREVDANSRLSVTERESRRRIFWTCYLLDRFMACGSKRPCLISDKTILLRLPCWTPIGSNVAVEGEFFQRGSNLHYLQGSGKKSQGSSGMLIDISRILGVTNQYLAAGGIKGDSHFPWHSLSHLSRIRQDLDIWASGTDNVFSSVASLFGQHDSTVLVLSKLIYHLVHCLVYRPFLPIDLAELAGSGQHQSWQIEATHMCFLHANAMAELVELGKQNSTIQWPAFVGYCICTAGTVHIHGAHYNNNGTSSGADVFASSAVFLSREMQQLNELRYTWTSAQHQKQTLQAIYNAHAELIKGIASDLIRQSPVFHLEDFFDRYANVTSHDGHPYSFDPAYLSLSDIVLDLNTDTYTSHEIYAPRTSVYAETSYLGDRPNLKRKASHNDGGEDFGTGSIAALPGTMSNATFDERQYAMAGEQHAQPIMFSPVSVQSQLGGAIGGQLVPPRRESLLSNHDANNASLGSHAGGGFPTSIQQHPQQPQPPQQARPPVPTLGSNTLSPAYNFATPIAHLDHLNSAEMRGSDPMFGTVPTNAYSSPAAWHGEPENKQSQLSIATALAQSPGAASQQGSAGTGPEEKDPFLSLLEQLAENEQGRGNELDFFLAGSHG
ncbi:fungal-specific transcription factor domain-containing protein [Microdochium trichocladiopsis]|uniref:Fungal-specific transcription factor domain-containing protein n=1 Tax=Microdochium trichocladiopsis TaxID=1682393 RepID=A0A9P9BQD2_9PEZI|nr:fungal-specific transcription factor domain-containing protein [Microdochium trichocladiopsis]KAH7030738.1 fungal-specific transcription factor domain-containing protein [Microdochium trichocladiopsis]